MNGCHNEDAARVALEREKSAFHDGADDLAGVAAVACGQDLARRIAAAGGIDAWRKQPLTASTAA